jgi:hypothetical protein
MEARVVNNLSPAAAHAAPHISDRGRVAVQHVAKGQLDTFRSPHVLSWGDDWAAFLTVSSN